MEPAAVTVVTDRDVELPGWRDGDRLLVPAAELPSATGWALKPEGLCQGDVCVPVRDRAALVRPASTDGGDLVDLAAMAQTLRRPYAAEPEVGLAVMGESVDQRREKMTSLEAPDFTLPDLAGNQISLRDFAGKKRLLVAFASW